MQQTQKNILLLAENIFLSPISGLTLRGLAGPGLGETTKVGGAREKARLFENFSILTETLNKCFNFQYVLFQIKGL